MQRLQTAAHSGPDDVSRDPGMYPQRESRLAPHLSPSLERGLSGRGDRLARAMVDAAATMLDRGVTDTMALLYENINADKDAETASWLEVVPLYHICPASTEVDINT